RRSRIARLMWLMMAARQGRRWSEADGVLRCETVEVYYSEDGGIEILVDAVVRVLVRRLLEPYRRRDFAMVVRVNTRQIRSDVNM
ncbi:hypothetical protein A2U01_0042130, partial [Trifolium medium]|nr:hypothetical protein [Trifolium medium]